MKPSWGIISAPRPTSRSRGATFVIRPGTSEPIAPTIADAAEIGDCLAWVAFDWLEEELEVELEELELEAAEMDT